jgi:hypothetical protein
MAYFALLFRWKLNYENKSLMENDSILGDLVKICSSNNYSVKILQKYITNINNA